MQLQLHPALSQATWKGHGPQECYPDRRAAAVDAYHRAPAAALHVPYIVPGENGARAARWVQFETPQP